MERTRLTSWAEVAARITLARDRAGFSQRELAERLGLGRSALTRIELGQRQVDALELATLAEVLGRSVEWFVTATPGVIASHRSELAAGQEAGHLEEELEQTSRDVQLLAEIGVLSLPVADAHTGVTTLDEAQARAAQARIALGQPDGPLVELQSVVERLGLLAFSLDLGSSVIDGGYVRMGSVGVALINGSAEPGRRRFNLAHELGHHLLADEYTAEFGVGTARESREALINAFAIHFLLPRPSIVRRWNELDREDSRTRLVILAAEYRVSWSAMISQAVTLGLVPREDMESFKVRRPVPGDYLETGVRFVEELKPVSLAPGFEQAAVRAYRRGLISSSRTLELLRHELSIDDLPRAYESPIEALASEFEDLG